jgi:hypothetical protein
VPGVNDNYRVLRTRSGNMSGTRELRAGSITDYKRQESDKQEAENRDERRCRRAWFFIFHCNYSFQPAVRVVRAFAIFYLSKAAGMKKKKAYAFFYVFDWRVYFETLSR